MNFQLTDQDFNNTMDFIFNMQQIKCNFREQVLSLLSHIFKFNQTTFLLTNKPNALNDAAGLNINEELLTDYHDYYYKTDIFNPVNYAKFKLYKDKVMSITDIMSYSDFEKTEYYCDFLRRQNLYYELALPLVTSKIIGGIAVFREKEHKPFSDNDICILATLNRFIATQLEVTIKNNQNFASQQTYESIIKNNLTIGILILDSQLNIIHYNDIAKTICQDIASKPTYASLKHVVGLIDYSQRETTIDQYKMTLSSFVIPSSLYGMNTYYYVYITDNSYFSDDSGLTLREKQLSKLLISGKTNKQIANEFCISIHTVKTHIQNIYKKLNVENRSSLITKILNINKRQL